jgi:carbon monoxide dehydrogenase subunit G
MKVESSKHTIHAKEEVIFYFVSDFRNFGSLLPEQIKNYEADQDSCSFEISGLGPISLKISEKLPFSMVSSVSAGKSPIPFTLSVLLSPHDDQSCVATVVVDAEISMMMAMIAKGPLNNFVNIVAEKLQTVMEK